MPPRGSGPGEEIHGGVERREQGGNVMISSSDKTREDTNNNHIKHFAGHRLFPPVFAGFSPLSLQMRAHIEH